MGLKKVLKRLKDGMEVFNKPPRTVTVPIRPQLSLAEQVANLVKQQRFQEDVRNQGFETFEEANDFDTNEDLNDPFTHQPYRYEDADEERVNTNLKAADEDIKARRQKAAEPAPKPVTTT